MAHVPLIPVGEPRRKWLDDKVFAEQRAELAALEGRLRERRAEVHEGWGPKYVARVHAVTGDGPDSLDDKFYCAVNAFCYPQAEK